MRGREILVFRFWGKNVIPGHSRISLPATNSASETSRKWERVNILNKNKERESIRMFREKIPEGWKRIVECKKCGYNYEPTSPESTCLSCGSDRYNELKPKSQYFPLGKCPGCGKDLYAYRKTTELNVAYIPRYAKSVYSCAYCHTILGISEKAPVPFLWEIIRPIA